MALLKPWPPETDEQSTVIRFPNQDRTADPQVRLQVKPSQIKAKSRKVGSKYLLYEGQPGLPWRRGNLYLEHDVELSPVLARGINGDPGVFWKLAKMPQVKAALDDFIAACVGASWRLSRLELPEWAQADPEEVAAWERHSALAERIWWHWTHLGQRGLRTLIAEKAEFAFICGFSLHEIGLQRKEMDLGFGPRLYLFPDEIPELRAPWSVESWLTQRERVVGVVQRLSYVMDHDGTSGPFQVVIPWEKLDHFTIYQAGPTDLEGMSALRPARRPLQSLQQAYQLQALSIEVNGVGTMVIKKTDPNAPPLTDAQRADIASFLDSYKAEHMPWFMPPDGYELDILSPQSSVPDLSSQISTFERATSMALNQSHKLIGLHGHGSFAARSSAADTAAEVYTLPVSRLADNLHSLITRIIRVNFPQDETIYTPDILWHSVDAEVLKTYTDAGYIQPGEEDQEAIRDDLGMDPSSEPIEEEESNA